MHQREMMFNADRLGTSDATLRIVSLLPAATEIVCALGLRDQLVGVSHECDHPEVIRGLPVVTTSTIDSTQTSATIDAHVRAQRVRGLSLYALDVPRIRELRPDVVITQDLCNVCAISKDEITATCRDQLGARIITLSGHNLDDVLDDFARVGCALDVPKRGGALVHEVRARLASIRGRVEGRRRPRVLLVEWLSPVMVAGGWMPELARMAGAEPLIVERSERFKTLPWSTLREADPDVLVLFPCGFSIDKTLGELSEDEALRDEVTAFRATRTGRTYVADGNAFFNRPGPRLVESTEILAGLFHPERSPRVAGAVAWP